MAETARMSSSWVRRNTILVTVVQSSRLVARTIFVVHGSPAFLLPDGEGASWPVFRD
jgi:hypothetical protein